MSQSNSAVLTGREASRSRRSALVQGKTALPKAHERSRDGGRNAAANQSAPSQVAPAPVSNPADAPAPAVTAPATAPAQASIALSGRAMSRAHREGLVQGKAGLQAMQREQQAATAAPAAAETTALPTASTCSESSCRTVAKALRMQRSCNGAGQNGGHSRPSGRVRQPVPIEYAPKVADSQTYSKQRVTGVRIGRGGNVTGNEPGDSKPISGTQYIGTEQFSPREPAIKVGAARTMGGQVVTGSQVRSKISITGDESNPALRITGEADQEINDDLLDRPEQGAHVAAQFARMQNPHGHTVFGTNLGRSAKSIGSRSRDTESITEATDGGLKISGTAVGRGGNVTGDEPGSCHHITGDQYLMAASRQPLCEAPAAGKRAMGMRGAESTGSYKVAEAETWNHQRITGVDVEHNANVTGDAQGACSTMTGTPYVGPGQYELGCSTDATDNAAARNEPDDTPRHQVTGDTPLHTRYVTGTQRGAERSLTGTPYYQPDSEDIDRSSAVDHVATRFSVHSPQREAHRTALTQEIPENVCERITGTFAQGMGKITGNQEFDYLQRGTIGRADDFSRVTGEGRMEGAPITGNVWNQNFNISGTEGHIARERNPSERSGNQQRFAGSGNFKSKASHESPRELVTGIAGWSEKAAKVTLSGGAQG